MIETITWEGVDIFTDRFDMTIWVCTSLSITGSLLLLIILATQGTKAKTKQ